MWLHTAKFKVYNNIRLFIPVYRYFSKTRNSISGQLGTLTTRSKLAILPVPKMIRSRTSLAAETISVWAGIDTLADSKKNDISDRKALPINASAKRFAKVPRLFQSMFCGSWAENWKHFGFMISGLDIAVLIIYDGLW